MRDPAYRPKIQDLYVLGAGASYSATIKTDPDAQTVAPLDATFCARIEDLDYARPKWVEEVVEDALSDWIEHTPFSECGLEAAIIRQLSHMDFFESINRRRRLPCTQAEYLNNVAHLITFVLMKCTERRDRIYRRLAGKVFPPRARSDEEPLNRIITFNYDSLLDKHLLSRFSAETLYFDRIRKHSRDNSRRTIRTKNPLLLKLHGSVNWRCSKDEFERIIDHRSLHDDTYWIESVWYSDALCRAPNHNESPCIMPPIPNKPVTRISLFRFLWTRACEYLHEAENLIICGYSLPPTDTLAMSLFSNLKNKRLKNVTVVDPDPSILRRWRDLLITPRNAKARWHYYSDFREYVAAL